jgi:hypothetical protein
MREDRELYLGIRLMPEFFLRSGKNVVLNPKKDIGPLNNLLAKHDVSLLHVGNITAVWQKITKDETPKPTKEDKDHWFKRRRIDLLNLEMEVVIPLDRREGFITDICSDSQYKKYVSHLQLRHTGENIEIHYRR